MTEKNENKFYVATLVQITYAKNPTAVVSLISLPNESMGQLASRMEVYQRNQGYTSTNGYDYAIYCGELTHEIPPPPPPKPIELAPISKRPEAVPRQGARPKLKAVRPV